MHLQPGGETCPQAMLCEGLFQEASWELLEQTESDSAEGLTLTLSSRKWSLVVQQCPVLIKIQGCIRIIVQSTSSMTIFSWGTKRR